MSTSKPHYNSESINKLILSSPGLRTSPAHLKQLNNGHNIEEFRPSYVAKGDLDGYRIYLTGYASYLIKLEQQYGAFTLLKSINSLRARPRPMECGFRNPGTVDTWVTEGSHHHIYYKINNGQILVFNITLKTKIARTRAKNEEAALYKVTKGADGNWKRQRVARIVTQYAAINGILNDLNKATWLMGYHLNLEFKTEIKEFTLFHNPTQGPLKDSKETAADLTGITQKITKEFAKLLEDTQNYGDPVKWVGHSQGGLIFKQAVVWLNNGKQDWPPGVEVDSIDPPQNNVVKPLDKHSVAFHSAPVNDSVTRKHMAAAKITVLNIISHPYDAVSKILGFNTINPVAIGMSLVHLPASLVGTLFTSTHTLSPTKAQHKQNSQNYARKTLTNVQISEGPGFGNAGCAKPNTLKKPVYFQ